MTTLAPTTVDAIPAGTWRTDPLHSSIGFSVRHIVSTFRGELPDFTGTLVVDAGGAVLQASGTVASIRTQDESLNGHLLSPDFFDAEKHPEVSFRSRAVRGEGDAVVVEGDLTMKGNTRPATLRGTLTGPLEDPWGNQRAGLSLSTVIDRREWGLDWNMPLPGGTLVLGTDVTITAEVELIRDADA
ncbi:MAG: YceI family protein [Actinomycetota bacterium]